MWIESLLNQPLVQLAWHRVAIATQTVPNLISWVFAGGLLLVYALVAFWLGFKFQFLQRSAGTLSWQQTLAVGLASLLSPGISEELVFRVLLLPHPTEAVALTYLWIWGAIALVAFILYHPLNAFSFFPAGRKIFVDPVFLSLAALLGLICTLAYLQSGSLWPSVVLHWLVVAVWLVLLGGYGKLYANH